MALVGKADLVQRPPAGRQRGPAAKGRPAVKRAPRDPLKLLGLSDPAHALLVAPAQYIDCRHPVTRVPAHLAGDPTPRTFMLRFSGEAFGRDDKKTALWQVPSPEVPQLADLAGNSLYRTRSSRLTLLDDANNEVTTWVFGLPSAWVDLKPGDQVWVVGTIERFGAGLSLQIQHRLPSHAIGSVWARYGGRAGVITGERVERCVRAALVSADSVARCVTWICEQTGRSEADLMDACVCAEGFDSVGQMLLAMHAASSAQQGEAAVRGARRLSAIAMEHAAARRHSRAPSQQAPIAVDPRVMEQLISSMAAQGRALTSDQRRAALHIARRLTEEHPLSALLSGDVGTGKTLAFLIPAVAAHLAGAQVAIVAPLRLLADQLARELVERFGRFVTAVQRVESGGSINDPRAILVGTQGLLNAAQRVGYLPNFLIFDEQHRLSAEQREACVAARTHTLEVSATPIPRTLAASIYASIEQLQLAESPVKKAISSAIIGIGEKQLVLSALRGALARGERCAVIYPRVDPAEGTPAHECVTGAFASFRNAFPQDAVMIHGDLPQAEIDANLEMFRGGQRRLAIASSILEVGIDVPSISVMVVRDADSFGMSQLHQMRGRLARNGGAGQFFMVVDDPDSLPEDTLKRLQSVRATLDGFAIAEQDLLLRGFGELDGAAQSGSSDTLFKLVKLTARDFLGKQIDQRQHQQQAQKAPSTARRQPPAAASTPWRVPASMRRSTPASTPPASPGHLDAPAADPGGQCKLF
ncbi:MAG: RecG-like helicase [Ramlibacter sp.]|jgi:ATP-dependent DNA helicase RecG|nr:RecG-like helicase [Ramlibacter sp.]